MSQLSFAEVDPQFPRLPEPVPAEKGVVRMQVPCSRCRSEVALTWLLERCHFHWPELPEPNVFLCSCPSCGDTWQFQVEEGRLRFGYVYAAGRGHFADMESLGAVGLSVHPATGGVVIEYEGLRWIKPKQSAV